MYSKIISLYNFLDRKSKIKILKIQILIIFSALMEIVSVISVGPFMTYISNPNDNKSIIINLLSNLPGYSQDQVIIFWGALILFILFISSIFSSYSLWKVNMSGSKIAVSLGAQLYKFYIFQPWIYHVTQNTSEITEKLSVTCDRVNHGVINPVLNLNAKIVLIFLMSFCLIIYNPLISVSGIIIFFCCYIFIYKKLKKRLYNYGKINAEEQNRRFQIISETFGGIKEIGLASYENFFINSYENCIKNFNYSIAKVGIFSQLPRFILELIGYSVLIILVIVLLSKNEGNFSLIIGNVAVFTFASFKMLPAFQQSYNYVATIQGNIASFDRIKNEISAQALVKNNLKSDERFLIKKNLILDNVSFSYFKNNKKSVIKDVNITIEAKKITGIVGPSGSGKTTILDILLRLIEPTTGNVLHDGQVLNDKTLRQWQKGIGYVSQTTFLADTTIRENIAFGINKNLINDTKIWNSLKLANLDTFVKSLEFGIDTKIGERGIRLSGGQRQRIGIARAVYENCEFLILDEATSAVDTVTEEMIMREIYNFSNIKTIVVVSHRFSTIKKCDKIYLVDRGQVAGAGTFNDLYQNNKLFNRLANTS